MSEPVAPNVEVRLGRTPTGDILAETPKTVKPSAQSRLGSVYALLGDPASRYGALTAGTNLSMAVKVKMLDDPVIAFCMAYIASKLVKAEYEIQCASAEIRTFIEAMYGAFHREFMLQAAMAVGLGSTGLIKKLEFDVPDPLQVEDPSPWSSPITPLICTGFDQANPVGAWPKFDQDGHFEGFSYSQGDVDRVYALWITIGKAKAFGKYTGWGRLQNSYKSWWLGEFGYDQLAVHIQRFVDRALLIYFPPGKTDDGEEMQDKAIAIGDAVRGGATAAIPSSVYSMFDENAGMDRYTTVQKWAIKLLESGENVQAFVTLADHLDSRKAMGMLLPFQAFQAVRQSALGGPTTSEVLNKLATDLLLDNATEIDRHLNEYLFPFIVQANWGPDAPAAYKATTGLNEYDRVELFEIMKLLVQGAQQRRVDVDRLANRLAIPLIPEEDLPPEPEPEPAPQPITLVRVGEESPGETGTEETEEAGAALAFILAHEYADGHDAVPVDQVCPLCGLAGALCYPDHGGLCVCIHCAGTYDPELEL